VGQAVPDIQFVKNNAVNNEEIDLSGTAGVALCDYRSRRTAG
jgi:hypothetical protein